jgi:hypothetical protein
LPADHRAEDIGIEAGDLGKALDRRAQRAIGNRCGVRDQRQAGGCQRREAEPDQNRACDRNRRAETGCALEKCAEGERDQEQLQATVVGDPADGALQQFEATGLDRNAVEENDIEDDPADREEADHHAEQRCPDRHARGHVVDGNGDDVGDDQRNDGRDVRLDLAAGDQHQERDHRHGGGERRQGRVAERIVDLIPHVRILPGLLLGTRPCGRSGVPGALRKRCSHPQDQLLVRQFAETRSQPREVQRSPAPRRDSHARV